MAWVPEPGSMQYEGRCNTCGKNLLCPSCNARWEMVHRPSLPIPTIPFETPSPQDTRDHLISTIFVLLVMLGITSITAVAAILKAYAVY